MIQPGILKTSLFEIKISAELRQLHPTIPLWIF